MADNSRPLSSNQQCKHFAPPPHTGAATQGTAVLWPFECPWCKSEQFALEAAQHAQRRGELLVENQQLRAAPERIKLSDHCSLNGLSDAHTIGYWMGVAKAFSGIAEQALSGDSSAPATVSGGEVRSPRSSSHEPGQTDTTAEAVGITAVAPDSVVETPDMTTANEWVDLGETAREPTASEAASFDKTLARSSRRIAEYDRCPVCGGENGDHKRGCQDGDEPL